MARAKKTKVPAHIEPQLQKFEVPIESLHFDPDNARYHDDLNVKAVKAALSKGQNQLLIVQKHSVKHDLDNVVRVGNCRLQAAKELGWKTIAALVVDVEDAEATRIAIEDNRVSELGRWNEDLLLGNLSFLHGVVSEEEFSSLLGGMGWDPSEMGFDSDAVAEALEAASSAPALSTDQGQFEARRTPVEAQAIFEGNTIRQVVLHYEYERHAEMVRKLEEVRKDLGKENNATAIEELVDAHLAARKKA